MDDSHARRGPTPPAPPASDSTGRGVTFDGDDICANGIRVRCYSAHVDDVLVAFLELIRSMRRQSVTSALELRRDDIDALALHLDRPGADIVNRLAVLIGTTRLREAAMAARYEAGDTTIDAGTTDLIADDELADESLSVEVLFALGALSRRS